MLVMMEGSMVLVTVKVMLGLMVVVRILVSVVMMVKGVIINPIPGGGGVDYASNFTSSWHNQLSPSGMLNF